MHLHEKRHMKRAGEAGIALRASGIINAFSKSTAPREGVFLLMGCRYGLKGGNAVAGVYGADR